VRLPSTAPADVMALPHPDWIGQTVTFTGPEDQLVSLRKAAAGSAIVPWIIDYDRREEDFFHWLAAPKNGRRGVSVAAAHTMCNAA
jgi:hypothetical protein